MSDKKLSIIIVNFRSANLLPECLFSIQEKILSRADGEIIIVNNDINEKLGKIKEIFSEVIIVDNENNVGYGQACNIGAKKSGGEILLFLNPDTKILSDNINGVLRLMESKKIAIVGSGLVTQDGKNQKWCAGERVDIWNLIRNNLGLSRDNKIGARKKALGLSWVSGAAMFVGHDIFSKLGGFDAKFFMYFEDVDLCKRVNMEGYRVIYYPLFQVFHRGGESFPEKKEQKENYYASQEYYFKKHCGAAQAMLLKILKMFLARK
jgi:hypothetical protein